MWKVYNLRQLEVFWEGIIQNPDEQFRIDALNGLVYNQFNASIRNLIHV